MTTDPINEVNIPYITLADTSVGVLTARVAHHMARAATHVDAGRVEYAAGSYRKAERAATKLVELVKWRKAHVVQDAVISAMADAIAKDMETLLLGCKAGA